MKKLFWFLFSLCLIIGFSSADTLSFINYSRTNNTNSTRNGMCFSVSNSIVLDSVQFATGHACNAVELRRYPSSTVIFTGLITPGQTGYTFSGYSMGLYSGFCITLFSTGGDNCTGIMLYNNITLANFLFTGYYSYSSTSRYIFPFNGMQGNNATPYWFNILSVSYSYSTSYYTITRPGGTDNITSNITLTGSATYSGGFPTYIMNTSPYLGSTGAIIEYYNGSGTVFQFITGDWSLEMMIPGYYTYNPGSRNFYFTEFQSSYGSGIQILATTGSWSNTGNVSIQLAQNLTKLGISSLPMFMAVVGGILLLLLILRFFGVKLRRNRHQK